MGDERLPPPTGGSWWLDADRDRFAAEVTARFSSKERAPDGTRPSATAKRKATGLASWVRAPRG